MLEIMSDQTGLWEQDRFRFVCILKPRLEDLGDWRWAKEEGKLEGPLGLGPELLATVWRGWFAVVINCALLDRSQNTKTCCRPASGNSR